MNPISYYLCQQPVIGTVMWITTLCSFPPLFSNEPITLLTSDAMISKAFFAPVSKSYALAITFEFPSTQARIEDQVVGTRFDKNCYGTTPYEEIPEAKRLGLGRQIPFKVTVRNAKNQVIVDEKIYHSLCVTGHMGAKKSRTIGWLTLKRGKYTIEVTNLQAQPDLLNVNTQISLHAGYSK